MSRPLLLVVDDSVEIGMIAARIGRCAGWTVLCRVDLPAAWACLQQERPDLVLLDVHLPGANGLDLCRQVRDSERLADLPIALLGHRDLPRDVVAALEAGVDFVVDKDLFREPAQWQERISDILAWLQGPAHGRVPGWRPYQAGKVLHPDWRSRLRQALRQAAPRSIDCQVIHVLLRRAIRVAGDVSSVEELAAEVPEDRVEPLLDVLAEQVWRLLGSTACVPFWKELGQVFADTSMARPLDTAPGRPAP